MRAYLKRSLLFLAPIFILVCTLEIFLREIPNDYSLKDACVKKNSKAIKTLILGSSHATFNLNPAFFSESAYNLSQPAQSFDIDYLVLKNYMPILDSLWYIVLPISYFSFNLQVREGTDSWRLKYYDLNYGMNIVCNPFEQFDFRSRAMTQNFQLLKEYYLNNNTIAVKADSLGYTSREAMNDTLLFESESIRAIKRHTESDLKVKHENIESLEKIIQLAADQDCKVIFYTSPLRKEYRDKMNKAQLDEMYQVVTNLTRHKNVAYFDFSALDEVFKAEDFSDSNHLSDSGASKFSSLLNSKLTVAFK